MKETDPSLTLPFTILHRFGPAPIPFVFPLLPQRVVWSLDAPTSVQRTMTRRYVNDFSGPEQLEAGVTMEGTFGYMPSVGLFGFSIPVPGSLSTTILERTFETFFALDRQLKKDIGASQEFIAPSRLQYWQVAIRQLRYWISKENPLLYFYSLRIERISDYLSPGGPSLPTGVPGVSQGFGGALGGLLG